MDQHVSRVISSCNFHIRALRHICPRLTFDADKSAAVSIVSACLDYCKSLLHGTSQSNFDRLQRVQNSLARVVTQDPRRSSATDLRHQLHWLPIHQCVSFKLGTITFRAIHTGTPTYRACELHRHQPLRTLCSGTTITLHWPHASSDFHKHSFAVLAPGKIYLLPSVILPPWLPSKLHLKHISSTPLTRHAIAIHGHLRFTFPWHMAPTKKIYVDWLIGWLSQHQKGQTILDFNETRDDGVAVASAGPHKITCTLPQTDKYTSTSSLNFL